MTLEEVGVALKAERERRGLRIEDIANKLKISPRLLTALESGNHTALPHPAYVRGFVRSYASMLGISQDEVQSWLSNMGDSAPEKPRIPDARPGETKRPISEPTSVLAESQPGEPVVRQPAPQGVSPQRNLSQDPVLPGREVAAGETPPPSADKLEMGTKSPGKKGSLFLPFLLFLLCAATAGCWWAWRNGKLDFLNPASTPVASLDRRLPQADAYLDARDAAKSKADTAQIAPKETPGAYERQDGGAALAPAQSSGPSEPEKEKTIKPEDGRADLALPPTQIPAQPPAKAEAKQPLEATVAPGKPESHKLIITAVEECWVHSNADKTDTRQFSLRKGDTFALTFNRTLELKLGNAGGVRLRYDGEDLPPPGTSGQVRTISFPPQASPDR